MCKQLKTCDGCRKGSVLILVLIVVSGMTIVAFGLAYQTRIEMRLSMSSSQQAILQNLALSGIEAAKSILSEKELTAEYIMNVCKCYTAKSNAKLFEQLKTPSNEDIHMVFWIKDERSFLDLNKSDSANWEEFPGFTRDKRASILDWIDIDSDTNPDGAEADYYERLESAYTCKNASVVSLKEMLFVKNITRDDYLGNTLTYDVLDVDDIESLFIDDPSQQQPFINIFTTFGQETVNVNTVSAGILSKLSGLDQQAADIILTYRSGPDGVEHTDDDRVLEKAEDLSEIEGLSDLQKELLSQYCCFDSDAFRVFSLAKNNNRIYLLMATIKVTESKPQILCVERLF